MHIFTPPPCAEEREDLLRLIKLTRDVRGWLRPDEAVFLYRAARYGPGRGAIIEIGSWEGKSTIWLAAGSKAAGREPVHAIDPHTGSEEHGAGVWTFPAFKANIARASLEDYVVPLVMTSEAAAQQWSGPVRLLWIDGAHDEVSVHHDVGLWSPALVEGGLIAWHDSIGHFRGPKIVSRRALLHDLYRAAGVIGITTFAVKSRHISAWDRWSNALTLLYRSVLEISGRRR